MELADPVWPGRGRGQSHQGLTKVLNHLLVPAERLHLPSRQQDIRPDLQALTRLEPPQSPCFPVTVEDDGLRPIELSKVFQDKSILPPEDLLINITPEELSCDISQYFSLYQRYNNNIVQHLLKT